MAVERLKSCDNIVAMAQELGVHRRLLYKWRDQLEPMKESDGSLLHISRVATLRKEVSQLKRVLADKVVEVDFFRGAFWVADITYIRLRAEFVYLAVILDGFSRKVVGWALERTLTSRLAIAALERAIAKRQPLARARSTTTLTPGWAEVITKHTTRCTGSIISISLSCPNTICMNHGADPA